MFISACLDSIVRQTPKRLQGHVEVVCIDDGSTDESDNILRAYERDYAFVRTIRQENRGVSSARNRGLDSARGEWVMFLDSDDLLAPGVIDAAANLDAGVNDIVYFAFDCFINESDVVTHGTTGRSLELTDVSAHVPAIQGACLAMAQADIPGGTDLAIREPWAKLYRRDFLNEASLRFREDLAFAEDAHFNIRCLEAGKRIAHTDWLGTHYRLHQGSTTHRYHSDAVERSETVLRAMADLIPTLQDQDYDWSLLLSLRTIREFRRCLASDIFHPDNPQNFRLRRSAFHGLLANQAFAAAFADKKVWAHLGRRESIELALIRLRLAGLLNIIKRSRRDGTRGLGSTAKAALECLPAYSLFRGRVGAT